MKRRKEVGKELDSSKNFQKLIHLNALECDDGPVSNYNDRIEVRSEEWKEEKDSPTILL